MERYYYAASIRDFLSQSLAEILGLLAEKNDFQLEMTQRDAWVEQIELLKDTLAAYEGHILFEYSIPRLGRRIDAVLLIQGIIFILEFKVGADEYLRSDREQVWDYALDLKNFHEGSHNRIIIPILIATEAKSLPYIIGPCHYDDLVYSPILANKLTLEEIIRKSVEFCNEGQDIDLSWANNRYLPTPTIIEAASSLYNNHSVTEITRNEASAENLAKTSKFVVSVIEQAKHRREKSICFVTGVPGAGKTLVGLNVAIEQFKKNDLAVYLSGNQPLVSVLTEALARDKQTKEQQKTGKKYNITDARREVKSFIQIVHHYRDNTLTKVDITNGKININPNKVNKVTNDGYAEVEHVAIFDEAQRAWTKEQLSKWLNQKKGIPNFPYSEPEFLIWSLDLREDWAVIVCLVGGGQEINTGEAGIAEWIKALNTTFPDWNIYISDHLTDKEYAEGKVNTLLANNEKVVIEPSLHLSVSMRSFRTEKLSLFIHHLLDIDQDNACQLYKELKDKYPIVITRSVEKAKNWMKNMARGTERYGMVVSSQAYRLKPLAIDVRFKPNTVHWFLDGVDDVRSSLFLEDVATEFDIQGLELDWACLVWDGDFRYSSEGWMNYSFMGNKWQNINKKERKHYQKNAYRVLLTRARQGMVIVIPNGSDEDHTRKPEYYDATYYYLKALGLQDLDILESDL